MNAGSVSQPILSPQGRPAHRLVLQGLDFPVLQEEQQVDGPQRRADVRVFPLRQK